MCVKGNQTAKSDYKFGVIKPTNLEILDSVSTRVAVKCAWKLAKQQEGKCQLKVINTFEVE